MDEKFDEKKGNILLRAGITMLAWILLLVFGLLTVGWEFLVLYVFGTWLGFYFCVLCVHKMKLDLRSLG